MNNRNDYIRLYAKMNDQKFVIGILSPERFPHINLDLVFEEQFTLSHDLKQGSVHFAGYQADNHSPVNEDDSDDDLGERVPIDALSNGRPEAKNSKPSEAKASTGEEAQGKSKVKIVEPSKDTKKNIEDDETEDDEDDEDDDDDDDDELAEDEDMVSSEDDSEEEEDSDDETPKKPEPAKKRPGESSKTPIPEKKAKFSTPQQKAGMCLSHL
ncbi:Histone deacetylase HDT1 [Bienertia sinuspersici]